jgi:catechol 2,3-dioxygenase-like lactoylglutathione lyase family enzyme
MSHPVKNRIGGNFVPVRNAAKARDWYRGLLGLDPDDSPIDGHHLSVVPLDGGRDLVLDEMPMWGGDRPDRPPAYQTPAFMFDTDDVRAAHTFVREYGAEVVTDVHESTSRAGSPSATPTATSSWSAVPTRLQTARHPSHVSTGTMCASSTPVRCRRARGNLRGVRIERHGAEVVGCAREEVG